MDLEQYKQKTWEEMQRQASKQADLQKQVEMLESIAKQYLSREAMQRYFTLKSAYPEKAVRAISLITSLVQANKITERLSDEDFKDLLHRMEERKEFRIKK